jgi:uncharacterized protein YheU (UPF0270 family)
MDIPHGHLQPETLRALLVDFVTRDGAVQGHNDTSLQSRVTAVLDQLQGGTVKIVYDEATVSYSIVPHDTLATDDTVRCSLALIRLRPRHVAARLDRRTQDG